MLRLYTRTRPEALILPLIQVLETPLASPFSEERILIPHPAMGRWLTCAIAEHMGIASQIRFQQASTFIWQVFQDVFDSIADTSTFSRDVLVWRIYDCLLDTDTDEALAPLCPYLNRVPEDLAQRRWQLSREIASLFDRYQVYRPEMLLGWEKQQTSALSHEDWQAHLWQRLTQTDASGIRQPHRAELAQRLLAMFRDEQIDLQYLPERLTVFGVQGLTQLELTLLTTLSEHIEVNVFVQCPSENWWGDWLTKKQQLRTEIKALSDGQLIEDLHLESPNTLLSHWGQSGAQFFGRLHQADLFEEADLTPFANDSLLHAIQNLIQQPEQTPSDFTPDPQDTSLVLHDCYSPLREVQALHDVLINTFEAKPDLAPHDVLVLLPELSDYASVIRAVFDTAPDALRLPYSMGRAQTLADAPLVQMLLEWLGFDQHRMDLQSVGRWLHLPAIHNQLALSQSQIDRLLKTCEDVGIRWGLDANHRQALGFQANEQHTWAFGLQRLFMGYCDDDPHHPIEGVLAYPKMDNELADGLTALLSLLDHARSWHGICQEEKTLPEWQDHIAEWIDHLIEPDDADKITLQALSQAVDTLSNHYQQANTHTKISSRLFGRQLESMLRTQYPAPNFPSGRITFATLDQMVGIPARFIAVLGLNDGVFPRQSFPKTFDLIAQAPQAGDPNSRMDDRWFFLLTLMSAQDHLHLSYLGHSMKDNAVQTSSVLISDLQTFCEQQFGYALTPIEHPLHPFNAQAFTQHKSRAYQWLSNDISAPYCPDWVNPFAAPQPKISSPKIDLDSLIKLLSDPISHWLNNLGIQHVKAADALPEHEPFSLSNLEKWTWRQDQTENRLITQEPESQKRLRSAQATGFLPHGRPGEALWQDDQNVQNQFYQVVHPYQPTAFDQSLWNMSTLKVSGKIYADHSVIQRWQWGDVKLKHLIELWVKVLLVMEAHPAPLARLIFFKKDKLHKIDITPPDPAERDALVEDLVRLYQAADQGPVPLYPKTSKAYADSLLSKTPEDALNNARRTWLNALGNEGESLTPLYQSLWPDADSDQMLTPLFEETAKRILLPMLQRCSEEVIRANP